MAIVNIAAFFVCLFYLSYVWEEKLVEIFPVLTCMLVFVLYALALIGHLGWIDEIALFIIAVFFIWMIKGDKEKRTEFRIICLKNMTQASFITAVILLICVILCTFHKVVSWWDDINFWATDVKSLYYLGGFASKYGNVASEFGDYPPAAQLFKWWFLHFDPVTFREGLAFAGYYTMNIIFMLPILRNLRDKNMFMMIFMALSLWFLPSIAEVYGYEGLCADLTLACVYGGFLFAVTERDNNDNIKQKKKNESFYYIRLALYLGVLVLVKSVGFIWAVFGLVFFCAYQMGEKKSAKADSLNVGGRQNIGGILAVLATPLIMGGSWLLFCLVMRRVAKTTATAVKYITTDEYKFSGYMSDFAKAFIEAFVKQPLHKEKSSLINLTPLAFYLCVCLIVMFFFHKGLMPKIQGRLVLVFSILSGGLFYVIIFVAHITIFAAETQYLEASGMISSIERYGAPFTIGTLIFLSNIWLEYGECIFGERNRSADLFGQKLLKKYGTCLCFVLFVALTAGYKNGYHGLVGYHSEVADQLAYRADMLDNDARIFLNTLKELETNSSTRVLYIQRDDEPRWVRNSYTNLEASPISVVYISFNLDDVSTDRIAQEIRNSHAFYLYVETSSADSEAVFGAMMADGAFSYEKLYRIEDNGEQLHLFSLP